MVLSTGGVGGQAAEDHGDTVATATILALGSSVAGRIDPDGDRDVFKLDLSSTPTHNDIWIYATGDLDTFGELLASTGEVIVSNETSHVAGRYSAFHIRRNLSPGVYYVRVRGSSVYIPTGSYTLHAEVVTDPGSSTGTATSLNLDSPTPGTIDTADDADYFRLEFTEATNLIIHATSLVLFDGHGERLPLARLGVEALDSSGTDMPLNLDFTDIGFRMEDGFGPGTSYLKVFTPDQVTSHPVHYTIHALEDTDYTDFIKKCEGATRPSEIDDALYGCQWHLNNRDGENINVEAVWAEGIKGEGVNVVVVDDGMHYAHEDLRENVDASRNHDYNGNGDIYHPGAHHGTRVAGIIAARDNGIGIRGVAPRATIYGYNSRVYNTSVTRADAMARNSDVTAVSNNSWSLGDGPGLRHVESSWELAVNAGITTCYGGKGTFYAFAAGNGHRAGDDSNLSELSNYYGVTAVCAVDDNDTRSYYSEMGANLWVCAPSSGGSRGIITTETSDRYDGDFGGTSAATPVVAGVAALLRDANPDLTCRDLNPNPPKDDFGDSP